MRTLTLMAAWGLVLALAVGAAFAEPERISLTLKDADLQSALTMLFKDTGKSFVIESGARGDINVSLYDVPWEQALRATLESVGATYVRDGDIYRIRPAVTPLPPAPPPREVSKLAAAGFPSLPAPSSGAPTAAGAIYLGFIPVRHASVTDMALWFGGTAVYPSTTSMPGMTGYGIGQTGTVGGGAYPGTVGGGTYPGTVGGGTYPGTLGGATGTVGGYTSGGSTGVVGGRGG
jgi:hypothetical protein